MAFLWFLRAPLYRVLFRFKKFFEFSTLSVIFFLLEIVENCVFEAVPFKKVHNYEHLVIGHVLNNRTTS